MFADFRLLNGRTSLKVIKPTSLSVSLVLFIGLLDNNGRLGDPTLPVYPRKNGQPRRCGSGEARNFGDEHPKNVSA